jgi:tRNA(adenine34) deaminase
MQGAPTFAHACQRQREPGQFPLSARGSLRIGRSRWPGRVEVDRNVANGRTDEEFMRAALELAREARERGEVPVGAVLVMDGEIMGRGFNQPVSRNDPTAHAEIVALRQAGRAAGNYRLPGSTMYVTIEPCQMCVGAMVHARVARVVYGTPEPKAGAIESAMRAHEHPSLNHRLEVTGRVLEDECREVIQAFFQERRAND